MSFFKNQFANVVEWEEWSDEMLFWKWTNREIKKGSKLIIRPGQDAIFLYNGKVEGIFSDDGEYDIESQIIPFLSTLKGFKFGFNSGMRAEVLFVNTKEFVVRWGTQSPINLPTPTLPGGLPVRANGTFNLRLDPNAYPSLIENIAGVRQQFSIEDIRLRVISSLDQLLMKWISKEGKDMFHLQANASDISSGIRSDLNEQMIRNGIAITDFQIMSITYPEEIQDMINKNAAQSMVGDVGRYQQVSMTDAMASGKLQGGSTAADMAGMMMGMQMANQMLNQMNQSMQGQTAMPTPNPTMNAQNTTPNPSSPTANIPNFCPNCGTKTNGSNFCGNCGQKLI